MDTIRLAIREREETGNGPARRLRAEGRLPGVLYGKGVEAKPISIDLEELRVAMRQRGHNVVLELDLGEATSAKGKKKAAPHYAVVKEIQFHPTKRSALHVDLHEVDLAVEIEGSVSVELVGTPPGVADGGVMDWEHREVTVRALPSAMPEVIQLDVTGLEIGHHLTVAALKAPAGSEILDDPGAIIVTLVPPRVEQVAATEAPEPEVVGSTETEE
jgi:large subunit ribosomal protein L25